MDCRSGSTTGCIVEVDGGTDGGGTGERTGMDDPWSWGKLTARLDRLSITGCVKTVR